MNFKLRIAEGTIITERIDRRHITSASRRNAQEMQIDFTYQRTNYAKEAV